MEAMIQNRHIRLDIKIGDGDSDTKTTYNARYGDM